MSRKTTCGVRLQFVHAAATDVDVGIKPHALFTRGEVGRTSVSKNELCFMCDLCVKMSTVATHATSARAYHV